REIANEPGIDKCEVAGAQVGAGNSGVIQVEQRVVEVLAGRGCKLAFAEYAESSASGGGQERGVYGGLVDPRGEALLAGDIEAVDEVEIEGRRDVVETGEMQLPVIPIKTTAI